jgi:hypothetical protein
MIVFIVIVNIVICYYAVVHRFLNKYTNLKESILQFLLIESIITTIALNTIEKKFNFKRKVNKTVT